MARELLAERAHDRPAVEAGGQAATDGVHDLEAPPLGFERSVAVSVAQGQRDLVRNLREEGDGGLFVGLEVAAVDGKHRAGGAAFPHRHPTARPVAGAVELNGLADSIRASAESWT